MPTYDQSIDHALGLIDAWGSQAPRVDGLDEAAVHGVVVGTMDKVSGLLAAVALAKPGNVAHPWLRRNAILAGQVTHIASLYFALCVVYEAKHEPAAALVVRSILDSEIISHFIMVGGKEARDAYLRDDERHEAEQLRIMPARLAGSADSGSHGARVRRGIRRSRRRRQGVPAGGKMATSSKLLADLGREADLRFLYGPMSAIAHGSWSTLLKYDLATVGRGYEAAIKLRTPRPVIAVVATRTAARAAVRHVRHFKLGSDRDVAARLRSARDYLAGCDARHLELTGR